MAVLISHLVGCCSTWSLHNWHVCDLNGKVAIVNEWPCTLHPARLKLVFESAQVRVTKQSAVCILFSLWLCQAWSQHPALKFTSVHCRGPGCVWGFHWRSGTLSGAVVLSKELLDSEHSRVVNEVPPAATSRSSSAQGVCSQSRAVVHIRHHVLLKASSRRERCHVLCITALNPTWLTAHWKTDRNYFHSGLHDISLIIWIHIPAPQFYPKSSKDMWSGNTHYLKNVMTSKPITVLRFQSGVSATEHTNLNISLADYDTKLLQCSPCSIPTWP